MVTCDRDGTILDPGDVVIDEGRIVAVSPTKDPRWPRDKDVLDARGKIVLPGLINAHCHSSDTLVRGTAPSVPLEAWSLYADAGRYGRTPDEVYISALWTAIEALQSGTTTIVDHVRLSPRLTLEGLDAVVRAYRDAGIRAIVAPVVSDLPVSETLPLDLLAPPQEVLSELAQFPLPWEEQLSVCEAFVRKWKGTIGLQIGPSALHRCSDALLAACADFSARHGLRIHMHFLETAAQAIVARRRFPGGAAAFLSKVGALARATLVHAVYADEFEALAVADACVVHCPVANLRLRSGEMPWDALASHGVSLALGTDGALCNDSLSMWTVLKVCGLLHGHSAHGTPQEILRAALWGGARACGLPDVGRLEPGYQADLVLVDLPVSTDPLTHLVYAQESGSVHTVIIGGRIVVRDGSVTTVDVAAVREEVRERARSLIRRNVDRYETAARLAPYLTELSRRAQAALAAS